MAGLVAPERDVAPWPGDTERDRNEERITDGAQRITDRRPFDAAANAAPYRATELIAAAAVLRDEEKDEEGGQIEHNPDRLRCLAWKACALQQETNAEGDGD